MLQRRGPLFEIERDSGLEEGLIGMKQIVVHRLKVISLFLLLQLSFPNKTSDKIVFNTAATNYL